MSFPFLFAVLFFAEHRIIYFDFLPFSLFSVLSPLFFDLYVLVAWYMEYGGIIQ